MFHAGVIGLIGSVVMALGHKLFLKGIRMEDDYHSFPPIEERLEMDWDFGSKPDQ